MPQNVNLAREYECNDIFAIIKQQVVNHGVPEDLMKDTMRMFKEFFELPAEDKAIFYTEDARSKKHCKLYPSSLIYATEDIHLWRDNLKHDCHPLEKCILDWPVKPTRYR